MGKDKRWLGAITGLAYVVLVIIGFTISGEPPDPTDDSAKDIVDFYVDNEGQQFASAILEGLAATLFVFFAGYLRQVLREAEGATGFLSTVAFGGAVIFATGLAIDATITITLAETAKDLDPAAVQALSALYHNDFIPFAVGTQIFLLATGLSILANGALPKWVGAIAILLAIIAVTPIGFASFVGGALLVAAISVMLVLRARSTGAPRAT